MTQQSQISMPATKPGVVAEDHVALKLGLIHDRRLCSRSAPAAAEYAWIANERKAENRAPPPCAAMA